MVAEYADKNILLVEDDQDNLEMFVEVLSLRTPYHIHAVTTGTDALHVATQVSPDLFVLDYLLPDLDGLELYDLLHATPGLEQVPAIIISAATLEPLTYEIESRKLLHLQKPFHLNVFVDTIDQALDQSDEAAS